MDAATMQNVTQNDTLLYSVFTPLDVTLISILALVGLAAFVLNTIVVVTVVGNSNLRTPLDWIISSLAAVDILTAVVGIPCIVVVYKFEHLLPESISPGFYWKIKILWSVVDVFTILSVWHVLVITVDRYVAVLHPYTYIRFKGLRRSSWILIIIMWIVAVCVSVVPNSLLFEFGGSDCKDADYDNLKSPKKRTMQLIYAAIMIYLYHATPIVITAALNIQLLKHMNFKRNWTRQNLRRQNSNPFSSPSLEEDLSRVMAKTVSNVWTSSIVAAALVLAYTPYLIKWQVEELAPAEPPEYTIAPPVSMLIHIFLALNSTVNPIIYAYQMPAYRRVYKIITQKCCGHKSQQASDRTMSV